MSPLKLSILIHYYSLAGDYRDGDFSAPAVREAIEWAKDESLIELSRDSHSIYRATPRCTVFLKRVLETPLPSVMWGYK